MTQKDSKNKEQNKTEVHSDNWSKAKTTPLQEIVIQEIPSGSIIDIGGGGEGVIAQIGGKRITAVDKRQGEIDEARPNAPEANWVLADATNLPFADEEFDNATAFFSGMYMLTETKEQVFKEVYRVLPTGGEFWIWDSNVSLDSERFIIRLQISLPDKRIVNTGYGCRRKEQSVEKIKAMLEEVGFQVEIIENHQYWYLLKAKKGQ